MLRRHGCAWWRSLQRRSARLTRRVTEGPHPRRLRRDLGIALRLRSLTQIPHRCVFDPFALEHLMPQRRFRHLRLRGADMPHFARLRSNHGVDKLCWRVTEPQQERPPPSLVLQLVQQRLDLLVSLRVTTAKCHSMTEKGWVQNVATWG